RIGPRAAGRAQAPLKRARRLSSWLPGDGSRHAPDAEEVAVSRQRNVLTLCLTLCLAAALPRARAATPESVSISPSSTSVTFTSLAPGAGGACEPSVRVDVRGNCYVGGIRGVPAGVDVWRYDLDPTSPGYDPQLRSPAYLGQPDAFASGDTAGGKDGGGDIDI